MLTLSSPLVVGKGFFLPVKRPAHVCVGVKI